MINEQQRLFLSSLLEENLPEHHNSKLSLNQLTELVEQKLADGISFHLASHQAVNELVIHNAQKNQPATSRNSNFLITISFLLLIIISAVVGYFSYQNNLSKQAPTLFPIAKESIAHFTGEITSNSFKGVDIYTPEQSTVAATGSGEVIMIETHPQMGPSIILRHNDIYKTVYSNLSKTLVKEGDFVEKGEKIGESGISRISQEAKLHYAIIENEHFIDPILFMRSAISPTL